MIRKPFKTPFLKRPAEGEDVPAKKICLQNDTQLRRPLLPVSVPNSSSSDKGTSQAHAAESATVHTGVDAYYLVLWRNPTTKKNKTWDGDGVLSVINGNARLQDISRRDLGKTTCKGPLFPGSKLFVGGKEIEVDSIVPKAEFLAGNPFVDKPNTKIELKKQEIVPDIVKGITGIKRERGELREQNQIIPRKVDFSRVVSKTFKSPLQNAPKKQTLAVLNKPVPRHNPDAPGALILPRPKSVAQGRQLVDVVVDPILTKYLRSHQRAGVRFMYECVMGMRLKEGQGCILADDMGLGKTLQTIALIWTLSKQNPIYEAPPVVKKILVVCPATLINNWRKEFRKWLGNDRIGVFVFGDKYSRITDFTKGRAYSVMVVGYEKLRTIQNELKEGDQVDLIIADEGHRLKGADGKAYNAIKSFDTDRKIILSGTPLQNDLGEFHAVVDLVNPGILGKYNKFKKDFETPIVKGRQPDVPREVFEAGEARSKELLDLTANFILRRTSEVNAKYLPPKTEMVIYCQLSKVQVALYRAVLQSPLYSSVLGSSEASFQLINILKKLCNDPALLSDKKDESKPNESIESILASLPPQQLLGGTSSSAKLKFLQSLLCQIRETTDEKIIVISNYTSTLNLIERMITAQNYSFLRLDGQTPQAKRQDLVDRFNKNPANKSFVFLLSAKAGGQGLNLVGASRLVLFDIDWNPAIDKQAMARIHRDGQKRPCFIYRLIVQGTIEEKIHQRQITKTELSDALVDSKKTTQGFTTEELRDLFRLDETDTCGTHDLLGCECKGLGNARVLPENTDDDILLPRRSWGTTMGDPLADENSEDESETPQFGVLMSASQLNIGAQERQVQKRLQKANKEKKEMLALMQYLHIDANEIVAGNDEVVSLVEDFILLEVAKEKTNNVGFIFSKTNA